MASPHGSPSSSAGAPAPHRPPGAPPAAVAETTFPGDFRVLTPERVSLQYATAGIGSRGAAALVDTIIQSLALLLLVILFFSLFSPTPARNRPAGQPVLVAPSPAGADLPSAVWIGLAFVVVVVFLVLFAYFVIFEIVWSGQTPGKRLLGLRVIRENGYPIRPVDAVVRNLVRIVDALPTGYAIGLLVMLLNDRAKRLGDFAAGTLVVREASRSTPMSFGSLPVADDASHPLDGAPTTQSSGQGAGYRLPTLTPEHATLVRDFLVRREAIGPAARSRLAARLARTIAARYGLESLLASEDPEAFLERLTSG